MFTYSFRYYTITDMVKEGWVPSIVFVVIVAVAVPLISGLLGFGPLDPAAAKEILATLG